MSFPFTGKAVILARGLGKRMRAAGDASLEGEQARYADAGVKGMIPIGRPFLDYGINALADAGCRKVCLVIGPEHDVIRNYYSSLKTTRVQISFAIQQQALGTADAVFAAKEFIGNERFLMVNSDNIYPVEALQRLVAMSSSGLIGFDREALIAHSNIDKAKVKTYAILEVGAEQVLRRIMEKPEFVPDEALISMNCWSFTPTIFSACAKVHRSARGEYELQSAVQYAIDHLGETFRVEPFRGGVLDLSSRADITPVTARLKGCTVNL